MWKDRVIKASEEDAVPEEVDATEQTRWDIDEGAEIVPGRYALKKLGGGSDYEAYLAWDDALFALS